MNLDDLKQEQIQKNEASETQPVSIKQAYEWVKTGHWNLKTFTNWVENLNNRNQGGSK